MLFLSWCGWFSGACGLHSATTTLLLLWLLACVFLFRMQSFQFFGDVCKTFHYWVDNYTEALDSSLLVCPIHDSVLSLFVNLFSLL